MSNRDLKDDSTATLGRILQHNIADPGEFLRRAAAANYIEKKYGFGCSKRTLAKLACVGGGPRFRMAGRVPLYPREELDAWARAKIGPLIKSTSEISAGA